MPAVLIVEADKHQRLLLEEELQSEGHTTLALATAEEAMQSVSRIAPDVAVLDIRMPGLDGVELRNKLLRLNCLVPIIIYTAYAHYRERFLSWGADACVIKQSDLGELKATIRRVLGGRSRLPGLPPPSCLCAI